MKEMEAQAGKEGGNILVIENERHAELVEASLPQQ
jgi:hypothetical protein